MDTSERLLRPAPGYTVDTEFVVRVSGLPVEAVRRLGSDPVAGMIDDLVNLETWLESEGRGLSADFHGLIGATEDRDLRNALIELRRAVHRGREPRKRDFTEAVLRSLPAGLRSRLDLWRAGLGRRTELMAKTEHILAEDHELRREELKKVVSDDAFLQGLELTNPGLHGEAAKWLASEGKADRKLELRLFRQVSRVAAKTSPYSTFTSSGGGSWSNDLPEAIEYAQEWARRSEVRPNSAVIEQIAAAIVQWPEVRRHLQVRLNSSLMQKDGGLWFLGRRKGEMLAKLPESPALQRILRLLGESRNFSYSELVDVLAGPEDDDRLSAVVGFLEKLVAMGLLERDFGIPEQSFDYLQHLSKSLERFSGGRVGRVRTTLNELRLSLDEYARGETAPSRSAAARAVEGAFDRVFAELDSPGGGAKGPEKNKFYDDTIVVGLDQKCSLRHWRGALDDLSLLQRFVGLYDAALPGRLTATAFFADHYGQGASEPFLGFYHDYREEARRPAGWRPGYRVSGGEVAELMDSPYLRKLFDEPELFTRIGLEELTELDRLQRESTGLVNAQPVDNLGTRQIDPLALASFNSKLPSFVRPARSVAFYCQPLLGEEPCLVLNTIDGGFGRSRNRLWQLAGEETGRGVPEKPWTDGEDQDGAVYADVSGTFGSNANSRIPHTRYQIRYPGSSSDRASDDQISLSDLWVVHDHHANRLRLMSRSLGKEVVPLHLGIMADYWLPPTCRFLIQTFGEAQNLYLAQHSFAFVPPEEAVSVQSAPRLCLGRVVINRATWTVLSNQVPHWTKGESRLDYLVKLSRWRAEHGVPRRCFVRALANEASSSGEFILDKDRKPLYTDFASPFSLDAFETLSRKPDRILVLQEALPDLEDHFLSDGEAHYASEYVFEFTLEGRSA